MNREQRGPWYLLTGLLLGAVLGVAYAWLVQPVEYINTSPASLRTDFKDRYRALIASAYMANNDLVRARARLELLQDDDLYQALAGQAQRTLAEGRSPDEARALGMLAVAIGQPASAAGSGGLPTSSGTPLASPASSASPSPPGVTSSYTITPGSTPIITATQVAPLDTPAAPVTATLSVSATLVISPTQPLVSAPSATVIPSPEVTRSATRLATRTPTRTPTPLPTRTPTPTPGAPFVLDSLRQVCDPELSSPLLQVEALDAARKPVFSVEVLVQWTGGQDRFFTGLKPEIGPGYGDFTMTPGVVYILQIAGGGQPVPDLTAPECEANGGARFWGSWRLVFVQP
jgi:hypothetical protein